MPLLALGALFPLLFLLSPTSARASSGQVAMLDDGSLQSVDNSPVATLQELRHLGVGIVRYVVHWADIAPDSSSSTMPHFNASDPGAYPAANWAALDQVVRTANSDGIRLMITVAGHVPRWAFGPNEPSDPQQLLGAWKPSASEYGQFVHAVATRYSGHYQGLPAVHAWELYNEPNFGQDLSPQSVGSVITSADMYRSMVASSWSALQATGHGHDTILIGALSAHGENNPNVFGEAKPLQFMRELYCLDSSYHFFRGSAARTRGCPSSAAKFRKQNPGLFNASGFSIHPYPLGADMTVPPNRTRTPDKDYATFVQLPNVIKALDKSLGADGSHKHYAVWNTEYGYVSDPPRTDGVSVSNQAYYLNWAEYLSWKNPRIVSFMQFLLADPNPNVGVVRCGGFASGLLFNPAPPTIGGCGGPYTPGAPKPAYDAWRLPLYLPQTSTRRGKTLEVWGCVRPAQYALRDTHSPQVGHIQFASSGSTAYSDIATVTFRNPNGSCYFNLHLKFPSSGTVRLAYTYPPSDARLAPTTAYADPLSPAVSRSISITVK